MRTLLRKTKTILTRTFILFVLSAPLLSEDYQYQYFTEEKDKYTPFSDYIPRVRRHYYTVPHYLEDYYELYGMKQHYNENSLRKNILMLKTALECNFRHPLYALCKTESDQEYYKYRNLMFMHINLLIMRNYTHIAVRYDKREIKYYDEVYAEEIQESLQIAEQLYAEALPYWREAKRYAARASTVKKTLDLGFIESERYSIITGELDYERIIKGHIANTQKKRQKLESYLSDAR